MIVGYTFRQTVRSESVVEKLLGSAIDRHPTNRNEPIAVELIILIRKNNVVVNLNIRVRLDGEVQDSAKSIQIKSGERMRVQGGDLIDPHSVFGEQVSNFRHHRTASTVTDEMDWNFDK